MERSLRWKSLFLTVLVALSILCLLPSMGVGRDMPAWFHSLFGNRIQLGLDLQGGLHIVYGVDLDRVVDDKANEVRRDLEVRLAEKQIAADVLTPRSPIGSVYVVAKDAAAKTKLDGENLFSDYTDVLDSASCPATVNGALALCRRVSLDYAETIQKAAIEQAIKTVHKRVDAKGIAEATIVQKGFDIIAELPGEDKAAIDTLKNIIDKTALLEFKFVLNDHEYTRKLTSHVGTDPVAREKGITFENDSWNNEKVGQMQDFFITAKDQTVSLDAAAAEKANCLRPELKKGETYECKLSGRKIMEMYLAGLPADLQPPEDVQLVFEKQVPRGRLASSASDVSYRSYLVTRSAPLTGTAIAQADVVFNPTTNFPEVSITFNRKGGKDFGDLTTKNVGRRMAIILDEEVTSAPQIIGPIPDGRCSITMGGSDPNVVLKEAQDLVTVLRTGALPAPLRQESESQIGATLGQDAIDRAQISMVVGALLVIAMMLYFYRASGMIANVAMVLNVLFQMAVLAMFQATLTLPGIAGIVLTIGMAVDSNIIIYERIREELREGKTIKGAVDAGFGHAFWTVFDAHVTNFVAGFVLLEYGSGPIRGFAVMLLIGVVCNLFTSTWVSRLFFDFWLSRRRNSSAPLSI